MIKTWFTYIGICALLVIATALTAAHKPAGDSTAIITTYLKTYLPAFITSAQQLQTAARAVKANDTASINHARHALAYCRLQYKKVSFLLEYFFPHEAVVFNQPPKYEVDEPDMEYQHPIGLQVMEALLYEDSVTQGHTMALLQQAESLAQSAEELPALLYQFKATTNEVLESTRLEMVRIITLYITGYDAPMLKSGIAESSVALQGISEVLATYLTGYTGKDSLQYYLQQSIQFLQAGNNFDSFNRLAFLTGYALPLQQQLSKLSYVLQPVQLNTAPALNTAVNLFNPSAINKDVFIKDSLNNSKLIILGKELFFENALSGDNSRNCASCHQPGKYFTDGLARNTVLNSQTSLARNTPTLLYSVYQYSQFWDGRSKTIAEQAGTVLHNKDEMAMNDDSVVHRLHNSHYKQDFKKVWGDTEDTVSIPHVTTALAAYIKTLTPFQSAFDRYMQGDRYALTTQQQEGANLFMGKAACATCHFAPLFNGLVPPLYNRTEYEIAGTTATDNFDNPLVDSDNGRYNYFPIQFYAKAFKTPTVRNAAVTAPYMHNGAFKTLESVVEFYDKGGAAGMGLHEPGQTLSPLQLHLSAHEKECLVAFMQSLTDKPIQQ